MQSRIVRDRWFVVVAISAFAVFFPSGCDMFSAGLGNKVDINPPEVRITSPANGSYVRIGPEGLAIAGTAKDDLSVKEVVLSWDGGIRKAELSGDAWKVVFPPDAGLADGRYDFTARVVDGTGKTGEWKAIVNIDTKAPSIDTLLPNGRGEDPSTSLNGKELIKGIADDGIGKLKLVAVSIGGVQVFPAPSGSLPSGGGASQADMANWKVLVDFAGIDQGTGPWKGAVTTSLPGGSSGAVSAELSARAVDEAGNETEIRRTIYIDPSFDRPQLTEAGTFNPSVLYPRKDKHPGQTNKGNVFLPGARLRFTVSDDDGLDLRGADGTLDPSKVVVRITGGPGVHDPAVAIEASAAAHPKEAKISFALPVDQGEYSFAFSLADAREAKNGQDPELLEISGVSVVVDQGPPSIRIVDYRPGDVARDPRVEGIASDGSGIAAVQVCFGDPADPAAWSDVAREAGSTATAWSWSWTSGALPSGRHTAWFRVVDAFQEETRVRQEIQVDKILPVVKISEFRSRYGSEAIGGTTYLNGVALLSALASDSSGVEGMRYWLLPSAAPAPAGYDDPDPAGAIADSALDRAGVDTSAFPDGDYILYVAARDGVGNDAVVRFPAAPDVLRLEQSRDVPSAAFDSLDATALSEADARRNLVAGRIEGSLRDDDGIDAAAGAATITVRRPDGSIAQTRNLSLDGTGREVRFSYDPAAAGLPQGRYSLTLSFRDDALRKDGRPSASAAPMAPVWFAYDVAPPELSVSTPSGSWRRSAFRISGSARDGYGLDRVEVSTDGGATWPLTVLDLASETETSPQAWNLDVPDSVFDGTREGEHRYRVRAVDSLGRTTTSEVFSFHVDTRPPTTSVSSPAGGAYLRSPALTAYGSADGTGAALVGVYCAVGASPAVPAAPLDPAAWTGAGWTTAIGSASWTANLQGLAEGLGRTLTVRSVDAAGNVSAAVPVAFNVDYTNPTLEIESSYDGTVYRNGSFSVAGSVADNLGLRASSPLVVAATRNGASHALAADPSVAGNGAWSQAVDVSADGTYDLFFTAHDAAGNSYAQRRTVVVDSTPPSVAIASPAAGTWIGVGRSSLNGTASDLGSNVAAVFWWVGSRGAAAPAAPAAGNPGAWSAAAGTANWIASFDAAAEGPMTLHVRALDGAGNLSAAATRDFSVDAADPTLDISKTGPYEWLSANPALRTGAFTLSGAAGDTNALAAANALTVSVDGGADRAVAVGAGGSWSIAEDPAEGRHSYRFRATDVVGRTVDLVQEVVVDRTPPTVQLTSVGPFVSGDTANGNLRFSALASDANGVDGLRCWLLPAADEAPASWDAAGAFATIDASSISNQALDTETVADGAYRLYIGARDKAGNFQATAGRRLVVDQVSDLPTLAYDNIDAAVTGEANAAVNILSGNLSGAISDDDAVLAAAGSATIRIERNAGTMAAPDYRLVHTGNLALTGSGRSVAFSFDPAAAGLAQGRYRFTVAVSDNAAAKDGKPSVGNAAAAPVWFAYDTQPPSIAVSTDTGNWHRAAFSVAGTARDSYGLDRVDVSADGGATWTPVLDVAGETVSDPQPWSYALPAAFFDGSREGPHSLRFRAVDSFGRATPADFAFSVDTRAAAPSIASPSDGSWINSSSTTLVGTAVDAGSGGERSGVVAVYVAVGAAPGPQPADPLQEAGWTAAGWARANGTADWNRSLAGLAEGAGRIHVRSVDAAGNVGSASSTVNVDLTPPTIAETALGSAAARNALFRLGGGAADPGPAGAVSGLARIVVTEKRGAAAAVQIASIDLTATYPASNAWETGAAADLPHGAADDATADGRYDYAITAIDRAGNSSSVAKTVTVDHVAPPLPLIAEPAAGSDVASASVRISGSAPQDPLSGLDFVEWTTAGAAAPDESWTQATGTANWFASTGDLGAQGAKSVHVRSRDKAGNRSSVARQDFWYDAEPPALAFGAAAPAANARFNGASAVSVPLAASDANGVASVRFAFESSDLSAGAQDASFDAGSGFWTAALSPALLQGLAAAGSSATRTLYVRATDGAGRTTTVSRSFVIDRSPPAVVVNAPAPGAVLNGLFRLSGTAEDDQAVASVSLSVLNAGADPASAAEADWTALPGSPAGLGSWSLAGIDSALLDDGAYGAALGGGAYRIHLRARAVDSAGNVGAAVVSVDVDQQSDRPVVSLTNVAPAGGTTLKLANTVYGSISDDDGPVSSFEISEAADFSNPRTVPVSPGGAWTYAASAGDGEKRLHFRVVDARGASFGTDQPSEPRVANGAAYHESFVSFRVDTRTPEIDSIVVDRVPDANGDFLFEGDANTVPLSTNMAFGGPRARFALSARASDSNGIRSVRVHLPGVAGSPFEAVYHAGSGTYRTGAVDLSAADDGTIELRVHAVDNSDLEASATRVLLADNRAPAVVFRNPPASEIVNGDTTISGTADDGAGASGLRSISYRVGLNNADADPANDDPWRDAAGTLFNWQIPLTGANNANVFAVDGRATDANSDGVWDVPVYVRAEDNAGNVYDSSAAPASPFILQVDPSGDRPRVAVAYPDPAAENRVLGGIIRIFGSAIDDDGVAGVYMQIDVNGDGAFTAADVAPGDYDGNPATPNTNVDWFAGDEGRLVGGTVSWKAEINAAGEFNPAGAGIRPIHFRVRSRDINGLFGVWSAPQRIEVDRNVPKIGSTEPSRLVQGSVVRGYQADMWLRGDWTFVTSVEDESGISNVVVSGSDGVSGSLTSNSGWFSAFSPAGGGAGYRVAIPVSTPAGASGIVSFAISAYDDSTPQNVTTTTINLRYDNRAPTVNAYAGSLPVIQSNRRYSLESSVVEEGSGLERVAFCFVRDVADDAQDRLYDPMVAKDGNANRTFLASLTEIDGLYYLSRAADLASRPTTRSLRDPGIAGNPNVRVGGLVRIGGLNRRIISWDSGSGTIGWADEVDQAVTAYQVAYALVVDNPVVETPVWNPDGSLASIANDDGDGLIETLARTGGSYDWTAAVDSKNIPDGPILIRWVAFDKAGNAASGSVSTSVQNNRPRVARVTLGTDLSGDGDTADPGESRTVFNAAAGEESWNARADSASFTARGLTDVDVDVVGGNGLLAYRVFDADAAALAAIAASPGAVEAYGAGSRVRDLTDFASAAARSLRATFTAAQLNTAPLSDGARALVFHLWDSTEESARGADSQWARLVLPLVVDMVDEVAPHASVRPFYWNSESDNSLLGNSRADGHIEITGVVDGVDPDVSGAVSFRGSAYDDQRVTALYAALDGFGFAGAASKTVHGRNYSRVAAFAGGALVGVDQWAAQGWRLVVENESIGQEGHRVDWRLDWDSARVAGVAAGNRVLRVVAEDRGAGPNASLETDSPAVASGTGTRPSLGSVAIASPDPSIEAGKLIVLGSGDSAYARRIVSVSAAGGSATVSWAGDVPLSATAYAVHDDEHRRPSYQVDVVPYLTGIRRNSAYNTHRTRSGAVALLRGEAGNALRGFNLAAGGTLSISPNRTGALGASTAVTGFTANAGGTEISFALPAAARTGWLRYSLASLEAPNNANSNLVDGNREAVANQGGTALWTDDRYVRVWQSNAADYFGGSDNPIYPAMGMDAAGNLYASFSNYSTATVNYSTIGAANATPVFYTFDPSEETDIAVTGSGGTRQVNVLYSANYHGGNDYNWDPRADYAGGLYLYDDNAPWINAGRDSRQFYRFELFYHDRMLQQFKNVRAARGSNNRVHVSYYDRITNSIKYSGVADGYAPTSSGTHEIAWVNLDGGSDGDDATVLGAARYEGGLVRSVGTDEFSAVAVDEQNLPLVVYLDATSGELRLARANNANPAAAANWTVQAVLSASDPNYGLARDYFSAKVDTDGYLHIAFRNSRGELVYLRSTNDPDGGAAYAFGASVTLDDAGLWADLALRGTTPFVSYLSKVNAYDGLKLAFWDAGLDLDGDGTAEGGWETMTGPLTQKASNVRTSVEAHPNGTGTNWTAAIGFTPGNLYRAAYYIGP